MQTWLFVVFEMMANKNGIAAREIERKYDVTAKTAWFMTQRIREAMKRDPLAPMMRGVVVADETYIGGAKRNKMHPKPPSGGGTPIKPGEMRNPHFGKTIVLSLIDKTTGEVRSKVIPDVTGATLHKAIAEQVDMPNTTLMTDENKAYGTFANEFAAHKTVNHSEDEYVRYEGDRVITSNDAENFFSQLKRSHRRHAPPRQRASTCPATSPSSTSGTPPASCPTRPAWRVCSVRWKDAGSRTSV